MAIEYASTHIIGRSSGHTAVKAAAYRSGTSLHDERLGRTANYAHRADDVRYSEVLLPDGADPSLADRLMLWQAVEHREDQHNRHASAQLAKDHIIALPKELSLEDQISLARDFAKNEFVSKGIAVDLNIHTHSKDNPHAHLMVTTRTLNENGFGGKCIALNGGFNAGRKVPDAEQLRHLWADYQNAFFRERDLSLSVSNNNGDLPAELHLGPQVYALEKSGVTTERGMLNDEKIAARHATLLSKPEIIIERVSAHKSVFTRHDLYRELAKHIDDREIFTQVKTMLDVHPDLILIHDPTRGEFFTTQAVLETEQAIRGQGDLLDRASSRFALRESYVERVLDRTSPLSDEQRLAAKHLLSDKRLGIVIGLAGTGKSTMLSAVKTAYTEAGHRVQGVALAGKAADELTQSAGIASRTIHSWALAIEHGRDTVRPGDVIVMDEAGMVNNRLMQRVMDHVERGGGKLILVGDPEQLQPIQAGCPLRDLAERHGHVDITTIRRQHIDWQRDATYQLACGQGSMALGAYAAHGDVHPFETREAAIEQLIGDYLANWPSGESQAILAHRNLDVATINALVRDAFKANGVLGDSTVLRAVETSERPARVLELAVGDRLLFTRNDRALEVKNGLLGVVVALKDDQLSVTLDSGRMVSFAYSDYAELQHGYAMTIHKSQGVTVDRSYVLASSSMDKHLGYVAMSRHRDALSVYAGEEDFQTRSLGECLSTANRQESVLGFAERHGLEPLGVSQARQTLERTQHRLYYEALASAKAELDRHDRAVKRAQSDVDYHAQFQFQKKPLLLSKRKAAVRREKYLEAKENLIQVSTRARRADWALESVRSEGYWVFAEQAQTLHPAEAALVRDHDAREKTRSLVEKWHQLEQRIAGLEEQVTDPTQHNKSDLKTLRDWYEALVFVQKTLTNDAVVSSRLSTDQRQQLEQSREQHQGRQVQVAERYRSLDRGRGLEM